MRAFLEGRRARKLAHDLASLGAAARRPYSGRLIGVIGLCVWFLSLRFERQEYASDTFFADQHKAREAMSRAERAGRHLERSGTQRYVDFFKSIGIGLTVIGFGGGSLLWAVGAFAT